MFYVLARFSDVSRKYRGDLKWVNNINKSHMAFSTFQEKRLIDINWNKHINLI